MRVKAVLSLACVLALASCSSGGYLPSPAAPATATPQAASALAPGTGAPPAATASPSPAAVAVTGPAGAPELVAGLVPQAESDRYVGAVNEIRAHDEGAADWLVQSGLFLRDGKLDEQELQALDAVLGHTKDDPLWYVSHVRMLDGVDAQDLDYVQSNDAVPGADWFFSDDIDGLEESKLLSQEGSRSLGRIFERARQDAGVRLGLYLINTLGQPGGTFQYPVPAYNDQFYLLARLLERGVPGEYERAAVAAALTYGSLLTICDESAREEIVDYASERLRFLIDTDVLLAAGGVQWRAVDLPLEALMLLLWGGQADAYPQPGAQQRAQPGAQQRGQPGTPLAQAQSLGAAAAAKPLGHDDLARILLGMPALREMQDEMLRSVVGRTADEVLATDLLEQWWSDERHDEADEGGPDLNRQWARFREGRGFAGGAEAGYVLSGLAASINLPLPWAQLWLANQGRVQVVPYGLRLDPATRTLRLGSSALRAIDGLPDEAQAVLVWWRVPWDNWHLADEARSALTVRLPLSAWRAGVPTGYLLRDSVASEADTLAALGVEG